MSQFYNLLPEDAEYIVNLPFHLAEASMLNELHDTLIDLDFMHYKTFKEGASLLVEDYELALNSELLPNESKNDLKLIQGAIRLSADVLDNDPQQLRTQLVGRLLSAVAPISSDIEPSVFDIPQFVDSVISKLSDAFIWGSLAALVAPKFPLVLVEYLINYYFRPSRNRRNNFFELAKKHMGENQARSRMTLALSYRERYFSKITNKTQYVFFCINIALRLIFGIKRLNFYSRRRHIKVEHMDKSFIIANLLEQIENEESQLWLCPKFPNLTAPDSPLFRAVRGHEGIKSVFVTPNDDRIISVSRDRICVWDFRTGSLISDLSQDISASIISIALTPDGSKAIVASGNHNLVAIKLNDDLGGAVMQYIGHSDRVAAVAITPNGQTIVSASRDTTLIVWDLESGRILDTLLGHTGFVTQLAISPDGQSVVSGSDDGSLKVWNLQTGEQLTSLTPSSRWIGKTLFIPNSRKAATLLGNESIILWDVDTGEVLRDLGASISKPTTFAITPDGRRMVVIERDSDFQILQASQESFVWEKTFPENSEKIDSIAITGDGNFFISSSFDSLKIWDLSLNSATSDLVHRRNTFLGHDTAINDVAITSDGKLVISASEDGTLKIWEIASGNCLQVLEKHNKEVQAVKVIQNKYIVSSCTDQIIVWSTWSAIPCKSYQSDLRLESVAVAPDDQRLVLAQGNHILFLDLKPFELLPSKRIYSPGTQSVNRVLFSSNGKKILASSTFPTVKITVWDMESEEEIRLLTGHSDDILALAISSDDKVVISASKDETLIVWDLETGQPIHTLRGHTAAIRAVAFMEGDSLVVSVSEDRTVKIWDLHRGDLITSFTGDAEMACCAVTPDSEIIVVGDYSGRLHFLRLMGYPGKHLERI